MGIAALSGLVDYVVDESTFLESLGRMKPFYAPVARTLGSQAAGLVASEERLAPLGACPIHIRTRARIAVYEGMAAAPRVIEVDPAPVDEFIERLSVKVHELCRAEGTPISYTVIREVTENFIHADFAEPVVSILDSGATVRFADQGPGMSDKERVLLPGFTSARGEAKRYIRGVGSGLPIVRDYLVHSGGSLVIEDNLGAGSVVTVYAGPRAHEDRPAYSRIESPAPGETTYAASQNHQPSLDMPQPPDLVACPRLSARQKHVLALVLESGLVGPSLVSKELGVGISTAYRDLALLENAGLIAADCGKRTLTPEGLAYLGSLMNS